MTTVAITVINLTLTTIILILGISAFVKRKRDVALYKPGSGEASAPARAIAIPEVSLYIGIAFGLFAISHALTLAGLAKSLEPTVYHHYQDNRLFVSHGRPSPNINEEVARNIRDNASTSFALNRYIATQGKAATILLYSASVKAR